MPRDHGGDCLNLGEVITHKKKAVKHFQPKGKTNIPQLTAPALALHKLFALFRSSLSTGKEN